MVEDFPATTLPQPMLDIVTSRTERSILALLLASLVYGIIAAPWYWLGVYALHPAPGILFLGAGAAADVLVAAATAVLLIMFIARTRLEEALARGLGRWFRPLALAVAALALAYVWLVQSMMAISPLGPSVEYWSNLISVAGGAAVVALAVCTATRPSRLERLMANRLSRGRASDVLYRAMGILVLMSALIFSGYQLYRVYLYSAHCAGYLDWGWERCHAEFDILRF
jgi:hypothetical protein